MTNPSTRPMSEPAVAGMADDVELTADPSLARPADARTSDLAARVPATVRIVNLLAVTLPLIGFVATAVMLWGRGFDAVHLSVFLGMYVLTGLGITVGYHRLFTHRAFDAHPAVKWALGVLGSMAIEGPLRTWVANHRRHHQHADDHGDPHSPHHHGSGLRGTLRGLWHAHVGWLFQPDAGGLARYVPDLISDPTARRVSRLFPLWAVLSLLLPTALGGLLTLTWSGALLGFCWGGLARIFLVHHVTWSINSVCHLWGTRPFRSHDESRNNLVFGVIGMGEGWHNNHHAFPTSARHGLRWWEIDVSYWVIRGLAAVGLVWDVKVPDAARLASKRER
jgi:stearoyl-CoA desaturase (delta-9 desaturase)